MRLPPIKNHKWNYLALAFLIPSLGMIGVMAISQYAPFGQYSILYSDMYHQYFPFFKAFRKALLAGDGLLWSWNVGLGMDYLGVISYYLASPLYLLSVFVPESWLLGYFSLLMPVKLGLAALFFAIFLKELFHRDDLSLSFFGGLYGLCAWALGFQWNIMWLDTFALLPLVVLGTVRLLRDKKVWLYTLTLFLSIFANYYIGFFTCIFVLLVFICYQICRFRDLRRLMMDLLRIACFSALAIGMTAVLELPALAALQTTQSSVNAFPQGFQLNIADENTWLGLLDAMRQVAGNMGTAVELNFKEGLPNLYCGVITIILAFLFLMSRKVKLRDKICSVALLLFFNISFILRQLDYIWHGFHFTNMIPYRFSFLYSFVMLYMAYRAWLNRKEFSRAEIVLAGMFTATVLSMSNHVVHWTGSPENWAYVAANAALLLLYITVLCYEKKRFPLPQTAEREEKTQYLREGIRYRNFCALVLAGVMVVEIIISLVNFGITFTGTYITNYPKGTEDTASMIRYMKERENSLFYRAEVTHTQTLNDGALNDYHGISTFTSSANVSTTIFMQALGYGAKNTYNRYCFEESSPVANLFLNLKYMLERDGNVEENPYFDDLIHRGDVHLLENNAYLPLGFLAEAELREVTFAASNSYRFNFQNVLLQKAAGITQTVWNPLMGNALTITATQAELSNTTTTGSCSYETESVGSVLYTYTSNRSGFLCLDLNLSKKNNYTVTKNGVELFSEGYSLPQMIAVSQMEPGDIVEVRFACKEGESGTIKVDAYVLDEPVFRQAYDILSASTLDLTAFSNTLVEGTIACNRDGLLYTSIPQNGNWSVLVDGQPGEITLVGGVMCGVMLMEGTHTVTFTYRNPAFELGWKISLSCALVFLIVALTVYRTPRKKGKYAR